MVKLIKPQLASDIKSVSRRVDILESREEQIDSNFGEKQVSKGKKKPINKVKNKEKEDKVSVEKKVLKKDIESLISKYKKMRKMIME